MHGLSAEHGRLLRVGEAARVNAWVPYSRFAVGVTLEADDGRLFPGYHAENASFAASTCAERVALGAAIAADARVFVRIAITSASMEPAPPCGICCQAPVEFAPAMEVFAVASSGRTIRWTLAELLPAPFTPASLGND